MLCGRIVFPGRPLLSNQVRAMTWQEVWRAKKKLREDAGWLWKAELGSVQDLGVVWVRSGCAVSRSLPDCGAWFPAVEAAVNGLVDVGGLSDDAPAFVRRVVFEAPEKANHRNDDHTWIEIWQWDESETFDIGSPDV